MCAVDAPVGAYNPCPGAWRPRLGRWGVLHLARGNTTRCCTLLPWYSTSPRVRVACEACAATTEETTWRAAGSLILWARLDAAACA